MKWWRWVLVAVVAGLLGFAVAALVGVRISDPAVQGAVVGALAGVSGGLVGAVIGAWASRDVSNRTIADSREARQEARQDATAALFLQERRAAIVAVLSLGEAAAREAERTALHVENASSPGANPDLLDDFRRAWLELILLAPDLTSGEGGAYSGAVASAAGAYANWAYERRTDVRAGRDLEPRPRAVGEAADALDEARVSFLVAAMKHLGVPAYAQPDVSVLLGNWPNPDETTA